MKIMVCLKQVPHQDARLDINADGNWIQEDNIKFEINSYDTYALEEALRTKDAGEADVFVVSIGPDRVGQALRLTQNWGMFTTEQIPHGWFVVPGRLADGREVDLLGGGGAVPWERPPVVTSIYPSSRWLQLLHAYPRFDASPYWPSYAAFLCGDWNRRHDGPQRLQSLSIGYLYVQPSPAGPERLRHIVFLKHDCG